MMKLKNILLVILISAATSFLSVWGYNRWEAKQTAGVQEPGKLPINYAGFFDGERAAGAVDFTAASTSATPAVVHIKTKTKARQVTNNLPRSRSRNPFSDLFGDDFGDLFGGPQSQTIPEQRASGSGVLISNDGFIVTNNHVIDGADDINITLNNKRSYKATLIGADPSSDIAVLKIEGKNFPYLVYGNSDDVKLGQWVLAVGYPLTLDVTVTAGIISAKARSIGINRRQSESPIESFLQTDAAVNPGNSGGALINTDGQLIGINSAIASPTGSYAGYSYAVPVNIVKKVVNDLMKFGTVQRAYLGIQYSMGEPTEDEKKEYGLRDGEGVVVTDVPVGGAASVAGIKKGDIVTKINEVKVTTGPEMVEQVTRYKPGDKITVTYLRDGKENTATLTLKNRSGNTNVVKNATILEKLGGTLENLDKKTAATYDVPGGVVVRKIGSGALSKTKMQDGFVITSVNGIVIKNTDDLRAALERNKGNNVKLEGMYPGYEGSYGYPLNLEGE
ncbi:trypsin-like peptidase domain-containing protein [Segetibacter aerophilus]|uniref:Type I deoxyribonuclease HsdR n=1 Tax=Segetibacter aerophilus TaxID=670293 RepID=A0A512BC46_9BACT|nr:trypsin-like peptidase domain-containing protein [Segetibacter aerophilus]GEO09522.1 type I deoxyribonuclease HsdR [Segetibacter aerophilus]